MRKIKKSVVNSVAIMAALSMGLVGCGDKATSQVEASQPESQVESVETSEEATSESTTEEPSEPVEGIEGAVVGTEKITYAAGDSTVERTYKYDGHGNKVYEHVVDSSSDTDQTTIHEFNDDDNEVYQAIYDGETLSYENYATWDDHSNILTLGDTEDQPYNRREYTYDGDKVATETSYMIDDNGVETLDHTTVYTYDGTHDKAIKVVTTRGEGDTSTTTIERDFDTMAADGLYVETTTDDPGDGSDPTVTVGHYTVDGDKEVYYNGEGVEVTFEYDEYGNMTKQAGTNGAMGKFESTYTNTYDTAGNLIKQVVTYNGEEQYTAEFTYDSVENLQYNPIAEDDVAASGVEVAG